MTFSDLSGLFISCNIPSGRPASKVQGRGFEGGVLMEVTTVMRFLSIIEVDSAEKCVPDFPGRSCTSSLILIPVVIVREVVVYDPPRLFVFQNLFLHFVIEFLFFIRETVGQPFHPFVQPARYCLKNVPLITDDVFRADQLVNALVVQRSRSYVKRSLTAEEGARVQFSLRQPPTVANYSLKSYYGKLIVDSIAVSFSSTA